MADEQTTNVTMDDDQIAAAAYAELDAEQNPDKVTTEEPKKKEPEDAEPTPPKAEGEPATETPEAAETVEPAKEDAPANDDKVSAYAEKYRMTLEEAREEIEKIETVKAQYKNDPEEMARALRSKDREYSKLRTEIEKAKPKEPVFKRMTEDQFYGWAKERFKNPTPDMVDADGNNKMIEDFRRKYPAKSEIMSDDAIIEEIIDVSYRQYEGVSAKKEAEVKQSAFAKREELIQSISETDKRFIPDVKAILQKTEDAELLEDGFDIETAINWAKGRRYDADIKAAEERGYKRATQKPTIAAPAAGTPAPKTEKTAASGLSEAQKKRADEMFGSMYGTEEAYRLYKETFEEELKENKNFVA